MGFLTGKHLRIIDSDSDIRYIRKNEEFRMIQDEDSEVNFDTYCLIPSNKVVLYSMMLPAQVEENLKDVVASFIKEKEPVDEGLKIDFAYIKDKNKLKVLVSVIKEDVYEEYRNSAFGNTEELSGIIPIQILYLSYTLKMGFKEGLCVFREKDGNIICFFLEDGFPVAFLKIKENQNPEIMLHRFIASLRKDYDTVHKCYFGSSFEFAEENTTTNIITEEISHEISLYEYAVRKHIPKLNLLPIKERKVNRDILKYIAAFVIVIVVSVGMWISLTKYYSLKKEVAALEGNFNSQKRIAITQRKKLAESDKLNEKIRFFKQNEKNKKLVLLALSELTLLSPDDTYATSIKLTDRNNQVDLNGKSKNIFELQRSLSSSKYLKNFKKQGSTRKDKDGYDAFLLRGDIVY